MSDWAELDDYTPEDLAAQAEQDRQVDELYALLAKAATNEPPPVPEDNPFRQAARTVIEINREALDKLA